MDGRRRGGLFLPRRRRRSALMADAPDARDASRTSVRPQETKLTLDWSLSGEGTLAGRSLSGLCALWLSRSVAALGRSLDSLLSPSTRTCSSSLYALCLPASVRRPRSPSPAPPSSTLRAFEPVGKRRSVRAFLAFQRLAYRTTETAAFELAQPQYAHPPSCAMSDRSSSQDRPRTQQPAHVLLRSPRLSPADGPCSNMSPGHRRPGSRPPRPCYVLSTHTRP